MPDYVELNTVDLLKEACPFLLVGPKGGIVERVELGKTVMGLNVYLRGQKKPIAKVISRSDKPCRSTIVRGVPPQS